MIVGLLGAGVGVDTAAGVDVDADAVAGAGAEVTAGVGVGADAFCDAETAADVEAGAGVETGAVVGVERFPPPFMMLMATNAIHRYPIVAMIFFHSFPERNPNNFILILSLLEMFR